MPLITSAILPELDDAVRRVVALEHRQDGVALLIVESNGVETPLGSRHEPTRGRDECEATGKLRHPTADAARTFARELRVRDRRRGVSYRPASTVYPCGHCSGWHLTTGARHRRAA